jgi:hypothetical protein
VNVEEICTHTHVNGKIRPVETSSGMGSEEIKENGGGHEFNYHIL